MGACDAGVQRLATAVLGANGGFDVVLRLPGLAVSGSDAEQLGLAIPEFQDVPLGPAALRKVGTRPALLVDAGAIASLVGSQQFASAEELFQQAVGVVVEGVLYDIAKSEPVLAAGVACAYRVSLVEPAWS